MTTTSITLPETGKGRYAVTKRQPYAKTSDWIVIIILCTRAARKKGWREIEKNRQNTCLTRRIGSTTYKVRVHFREDGTETLEDKIVRIIKNEALNYAPGYDIIDVPQMSRPPEGSSV